MSFFVLFFFFPQIPDFDKLYFVAKFITIACPYYTIGLFCGGPQNLIFRIFKCGFSDVI